MTHHQPATDDRSRAPDERAARTSSDNPPDSSGRQQRTGTVLRHVRVDPDAWRGAARRAANDGRDGVGETVAALVAAYAAGTIHLPPTTTSSSHAHAHQEDQ